MSLHPGSCRSWPHRSRVAGLMIPWMISFILPCVLDGFHTSGTPIQIELQRQDQPSCRQQDQPTGHFDSGGWCLKLCSSYSCWLGSFRQWIFSRIAISKFGIMRIIVQIIAIIVSKYAKDSAFGHFHGFTLGSRASCIKLDHCAY